MWGLASFEGFDTALQITSYDNTTGNSGRTVVKVWPEAQVLKGTSTGWHIDNNRIYTTADAIFLESDFIQESEGAQDAGKPIILDSGGKVHPTMIDISAFYYVGPFTPTTSAEYPDTTGQVPGAFWSVEGLSSPYTFTGGDLAGEEASNGDFMVLGTTGWALMQGDMNPALYYKLDGTQAITGPFAGGGQQIKHIADGLDDMDAVTMAQLNAVSAIIPLNTTDLPEGDNKYYTDERVTNHSDVKANTNQRHEHTNKDALDAVTRAGDGTKYLADDGVYKTIEGGGGSGTFIGLDDTPADYANAAGYVLAVTASENGVEFVPMQGTDPVTIKKPDIFNGVVGDTDFVIPNAIENEIADVLRIMVGGSVQTKDDYTIITTNVARDTIRLNEPLDFDSTVSIEYFAALPNSPYGVETFLELTDTPSNYVDEGGKLLAVNAAENSVEFIDNITTEVRRPAPFSGTTGDTDFIIPGAVENEITEILTVVVGGSLQSIDDYTIETTNVANDTVRLATALDSDTIVTVEYFKSIGGISSTTEWGSITGTLSNQTDLQTELNAKLETVPPSSETELGGIRTIFDPMTGTLNIYTS
jgi:hypothetical protein